MNQTEIKTRLGLLLQECVEEALGRTDYSFEATQEYAADAMEPDFLIPDAEDPDYVVEVTQTEARDSFRMKTLRYFEAVSDAKAHFGPEVTSVNVLMGNPEDELPDANVDALCGFFDANLIPRNDTDSTRKKTRLADLEVEADALARDEDVEEVGPEVPDLVDDHEEAIEVLSEMLEEMLQDAGVKQALVPLWENEEQRVDDLEDVDGDLPASPPYKRPILQSLYLTDDDFEDLVDAQDPSQVSDELKSQLKATDLAEEHDTVGGTRLVLDEGFRQFIAREDEARELRGLCEDRLQEDEAMHWFFQDIRDQDRREEMKDTFERLLGQGRGPFTTGVQDCLKNDTFEGLTHRRCWMADLMPLVVGESHNSFNERMYQHPGYDYDIGNPFNNITVRSARLGTDPDVLDEYAEIAVDCFYDALSENGITANQANTEDLDDEILDFRIGAAVKLQKLNPLYLVVESACEERGFDYSYGSVHNILSDLADSRRAVGLFRLNKIQTEEKEILVNALWVVEYGGHNKSKEWSARGRSFPYRLMEGEVEVEDRELILIADGMWEETPIRRLRSGGWKVCRLPEFEETLEEVL